MTLRSSNKPRHCYSVVRDDTSVIYTSVRGLVGMLEPIGEAYFLKSLLGSGVDWARRGETTGIGKPSSIGSSGSEADERVSLTVFSV